MTVKATFFAAIALLLPAATARAATPVYGYQVVQVFPHDRGAFTEGLFYEDGVLWESTGMPGRSFVRREVLETGRVLEQHDLPARDFGEGIVRWGGDLYQLTWQEHFGYDYDARSFQVKSTFRYAGEGWSFTKDEHVIYMDDGTPDIRVLEPGSLRELRRIHVTDEGARIEPATGHVVGWIDRAGLLPRSDVRPDTDVLNGIAYDAEHDRLFVTGKNWPKLFQIRLKPRP